MKTILTVDGIDGSGKSMFARHLVDAISDAGVPALAVRVDDFRRPLAWGEGGRSEAELYFDAYYDLELCERALRGFLAGEPAITIPSFDVATEQLRGTRELAFAGASVVVVEGVFPLRLPSARAGFAIYLVTTEDEARRRIIERDLKKGRARDEIERRIDLRYFPTQRRYHALHAPRARADVVIDNEQPAAPRALVRELGRLPADLRAILDRVLPEIATEARPLQRAPGT